jgi:hypothetical protein
MNTRHPRLELVLDLKVGERVEVRSEAEILSTLDATGRLDALPFMPEMLEFCGKQFTVLKRADKTCDTINNAGSRRMWNAVHLDELRCNGVGHGGCQARCLLFWKEAWLKRADRPSESAFGNPAARASRQTLLDATKVKGGTDKPEDDIYSCQATDLLKASEPLSWWRPSQYVRDVRSGNASVWDVLRVMLFRAFAKSVSMGFAGGQIWLYDRIQKAIGGQPYPFRKGRLTKTPAEKLDVQPGDLVQIKSHDEILETLDERNKNRGLFFDVEMVPYCGGKYRVIQRVERIVNDRTGKLVKLPGGCLMLEGVVCRSHYSDRRIACPRAIYSFWREIWVRRAE